MFWCFIMFRTRKIYKQLVNWRLKMQSSSFKMFFFILLDDLFILARIELQKLSKYWKTEENYCISLWLWAKIYLIDALNVCRFEPKESSVFFYLFHFELRWWKSNKRYFDTKLHISLIRKKEIRTPFKKFFCYNNKSWNIHPHWFLTRDFVRIYSAHGRNKIKL